MMEDEQEVIYFMCNIIDVKFEDIIHHYIDIIEYAGKFSDSFSLITSLSKPYTKIPPNCTHDHILNLFEPYLINQKVGIKEWPGTITRDNHRVMNVYRSCKEARSILFELPNIFVISNGLPQDICFYRKDNVWFATVTHENMAYMEPILKRYGIPKAIEYQFQLIDSMGAFKASVF